MQHVDTDEASEPPAIELWDRKTILEYFGGLHVSTLYRGIECGIYPKPVHVSRNIVRWVASECRTALQRLLDERKRTSSTPTKRQRGRPRLHPVA
jgi:predicted DNA-binding transcriptional regulator AlpA